MSSNFTVTTGFTAPLFSARRGLFTGTHCEERFLQALTDELRVGRLQWCHFMYTKSVAGGPNVHATITSIDVFGDSSLVTF